MTRPWLSVNLLTPKHKSTVWELSRSDPTFPKPIKLSDRITRWLESGLEDWVLRHKQGEVQ